ncbi:hypothetical protein ACWEKT_00595 [Nocardia takedensis]|uniref:hypothetical protein n=1 Tax=Nocardia takedensis TaxID=259390 RepID=UPI00031896F0|nr:hypothetical protein [Nocardia takedensis]
MFVQYYFALGESDAAAMHRVRETVRFFLGCREVNSAESERGFSLVPGHPVRERALAELLAEAVRLRDRPTGVPDRHLITPMLGFDFVRAWNGGGAASCPRCRSPLADGYERNWIYGPEPFAACAQCEFTGLLGDWDLTGAPFAKTNCGVALLDWPDLPADAEAVHRRALTLIGRRPRYLYGKL